MGKRKNNSHLRLNASERPLFAGYNAVHSSAKDKERLPRNWRYADITDYECYDDEYLEELEELEGEW